MPWKPAPRFLGLHEALRVQARAYGDGTYIAELRRGSRTVIRMKINAPAQWGKLTGRWEGWESVRWHRDHWGMWDTYFGCWVERQAPKDSCL